MKQTPLWRDANTLLLEVEQAVRKFPRYQPMALVPQAAPGGLDLPASRQGRGGLRPGCVARAPGVALDPAYPPATPAFRRGHPLCLTLRPGLVTRLCRQLRVAGIAYQRIAEEGYLKGGIKRRVLRQRYLPCLPAGQTPDHSIDPRGIEP